MRRFLLIGLAVFYATGAVAGRAADTAVVKVLAYYPNGNVSQGTGWFFNSHVLATDYHVVRDGVSFEAIVVPGHVALFG
jgi:hypothetical protein